jgi:hypothetical protein
MAAQLHSLLNWVLGESEWSNRRYLLNRCATASPDVSVLLLGIGRSSSPDISQFHLLADVHIYGSAIR